MENKELMSEWKKNSIRIGTPTNLLAAFTSFIPVIWLCITYKISDMQHWSRARAIPSPCGTWESAHSEYRERP